MKRHTTSIYLVEHEEQTAIFSERTRTLVKMVEQFEKVKGFHPYVPAQADYDDLNPEQQKTADYFWNHNVVKSFVRQGQQADALADLWFRLYADTQH